MSLDSASSAAPSTSTPGGVSNASSAGSQQTSDPSSTTIGGGASTPTNGSPGLGHNSGDDSWRSLLSGGDEGLAKEVGRFKSAQDVARELVRQKQELSKGPRVLTLDKDAKPEQIAEYRKAMGVPDTVEGYDLKAPDGYKASDGETALISEFAKSMHAKNVPGSQVKEAVDFYRQQSATAQQAINRLDVGKKTEWQGALKTEFGKDYEPYVASATAFLQQEFADDSAGLSELVNARLPGGGRLGDNPGFIKMVVNSALKAGFTDRIEASDLQSGGETLESQLNKIEALRSKDRNAYNAAQPKLEKIIKAMQSQGQMDEFGNIVKNKKRA